MATKVPKKPANTRTTAALSAVTPIGSFPIYPRIVAEYKDKRLIPVV
jgi:hypothetical protein